MRVRVRVLVWALIVCVCVCVCVCARVRMGVCVQGLYYQTPTGESVWECPPLLLTAITALFPVDKMARFLEDEAVTVFGARACLCVFDCMCLCVTVF